MYFGRSRQPLRTPDSKLHEPSAEVSTVRSRTFLSDEAGIGHGTQRSIGGRLVGGWTRGDNARGACGLDAVDDKPQESGHDGIDETERLQDLGGRVEASFDLDVIP